MARLVEQLRDWLARAEIMARGVEHRRYDAARALEAGRPWDARHEALSILSGLPRSPVALVLWADAAEALWLDHEALEALERLSAEVPFRADVWLRLGRARSRLGQAPGEAFEFAAAASEPSEAADLARLELADHDLTRRDFARAERWLDQLSLGMRTSQEALARRAWLSVLAGDAARGRALRGKLSPPGVRDARGWLLVACLWADDDLSRASFAFKRALLLDPDSAAPIVQEYLVRQQNPRLTELVRTLVSDLGLARDVLWRATFAEATGDSQAALAALGEAAGRGERPLCERYLRSALQAESAEHLPRAVAAAHGAGLELDAEIASLSRAIEQPEASARLEELDAVRGIDWAARLRTAAFAERFLGTAWDFRGLLAELSRLCRSLGAFEEARQSEAITLDLDNPLRVSILGEFNAGKSSFVNALMGETVAPTGILPTTATSTRLIWSKVGFSRVELIDTPGFNAPDAEHERAARSALDEAEAAIWLFDVTQPLKDSERGILEQIQGRGVPLFALCNKLDRLPPDVEVKARAIEYLKVGLSASGITLRAPPVAFSARLALAGLKGDALSLERSNWASVLALLDRELLAASGVLHGRAIQRRIHAISARLAQAASLRAQSRAERMAEFAARGRELDRAAARARGSRSELEALLETALGESLKVLERDLRPVHGYEAHEAARRFIALRARPIVGSALARAALDWLSLSPAGRARLLPELEGALSAAAAALSPWLRRREAALGRPEDVPDELARKQLIMLGADETIDCAERAARDFSSRRSEPSSDELRAEASISALAAAKAQ